MNEGFDCAAQLSQVGLREIHQFVRLKYLKWDVVRALQVITS